MWLMTCTSEPCHTLVACLWYKMLKKTTEKLTQMTLNVEPCQLPDVVNARGGGGGGNLMVILAWV